MVTGDWWLLQVAGHFSKINKSSEKKPGIELRSSLFFVNFNWYITIEIRTKKERSFSELSFYRWWFWIQAMILCSMIRSLKHKFKLVKVSTQTFDSFLVFLFFIQYPTICTYKRHMCVCEKSCIDIVVDVANGCKSMDIK